MSIKLQNVVGKLRSVNPRAEICGEDTELGCDLKITFSMGNDFLEQFERGLKSFIYTKDEAPADLLPAPDGLTKLRYPLLGKLHHGYEGAGYTVLIAYGINTDSGIKLTECEVNAFVLDCLEGGTVSVTMRVQMNPDEEDLAKLCGLIMHEITFSVVAPGAAAIEQLFDPQGNPVAEIQP